MCPRFIELPQLGKELKLKREWKKSWIKNLLDPEYQPILDELSKSLGMNAQALSSLKNRLQQIKRFDFLTEEKGNDFVAGANKENYHISNINLHTDFKADIISDIAKFPDQAKCINCNNDLYTKKAIEVGHIFKLGTIYSEKFNTKFLTESGARESIEMGCYGIGTGRLLAAIIEQNHDKNGPIFPKSISPYEIINGFTKTIAHIKVFTTIKNNNCYILQLGKCAR